MLHRFKRIMQDAHALMDRCTRGDYWEHRDDPSILLSLAKDTGIDLEAEAIVTDDNKGPASAIGPNSPEDEEMSYELKSKIQRKIQLARVAEAQTRLEQIAEEAESLYVDITTNIQDFFTGIVPKAIETQRPSQSAKSQSRATEPRDRVEPTEAEA
jgi:hypothetical protein